MKNSLFIILLLSVINCFSQQLTSDKRWQETVEDLQQQLPYFETNVSCQSCENEEWVRNYTINKTTLSGNFGTTKPSIAITKLKKVIATVEGLVLTNSDNKTFTISFVSEIEDNEDETLENYLFGFAETKQAKKLEQTFAKLIAIKKRFKKQHRCK